MKYGYSNTCSEIFEAEKIEYDDCREGSTMEIVCPECREWVFKVVRDQATHYLSHYPAAAAWAADCELRVDSYDQRKIGPLNVLARKQKLEFHIRFLREKILDHEYKSRELGLRKLKPILRSKVLRKVFELLRKTASPIDEPESSIIEAAFNVPQTGLVRYMRRRVAMDMWRTLLNYQASESFHFLASHGYLRALARLEFGTGPYSGYQLRPYLLRLLQLSKSKGDILVLDMQSRKIEELGTTNYADFMLHVVMSEMWCCLLDLPFWNPK